MATFGVDNEGSGFSLDDDDDLSSMFNEAASASSDSGDDSILHGMGEYLEEPEPAVKSKPQPRKPEPEPEPEPIVFEEEEDDDDFDLESLTSELDKMESFEEVVPEPEPVVEPEPEPVMVEPEPKPEPVAVKEPEPVVVEKPRAEDTPMQTPAGPRVRVPSEADQIAEAGRIIRILDAYRRLKPEEKSVTTQFVTGGQFEETEDQVLVVKVINCDPLLTITMRALREAYECDSVERAFYTISLETRILHNLGSLVAVFTGDEFDTKEANIDYSRALVSAISNLGDREISFVKATESVLTAAEKVSYERN